MNKRMILYIQGAILLIESAIMVLPIAAALIYRETSGVWFFYTALAAAICGFAAMKLSKPRTKTIYAKEGLITVALGWIVLSLVGALPFTLSGEIPCYLDAVFEMISGFTTTGSSILTDVEALLFALAGRHGHSGIYAGHRQNGRRAGHPSPARREPGADGRQDGPANGRLVENPVYDLLCAHARTGGILPGWRHAAF